MSRKEYTDTPEQFREWLRENGLDHPVTGKEVVPSPFDATALAEVIKPLIIAFNDFEGKMSLLRPKIEELASFIQCPECGDFKTIVEETCEWCRKPE